MTNQNQLLHVVSATKQTEGAGVLVRRTIGGAGLRRLDPFMLLDHMGSDNPDDYLQGFPSHPHRGFNTFTYMIDGRVQHQDSMGNVGELGPGDAQWMKAASGVIHSEIPRQTEGVMRGFQLWVNLPAKHKFDNPEYQEYSATAFPVIRTDQYELKILIGSFKDQSSPIVDDMTEVRYLDVRVNPGQRFEYSPIGHHNSFLYVFEGEAKIASQPVKTYQLAVLDSGVSAISIEAGDQGVRFLLVSGRAIGEPVAQYGPFVMNSPEEIDQAIQDYQSNHFVRHRAWVNRQKQG